MRKQLIIALAAAVLAMPACKKSNDEASSTDNSEAAQQIGDIMASIDESGGSSGSLGFLGTFARLAPEEIIETESVGPRAVCGTTGFSSCSSNTISRTFNGCSVGAATLNGTVSFSFNDSAVDSTCLMGSTGHSITRVPNFTVTGLRGATLTVTKSATEGQRISKTGASAYSFSNDGIQRVFTAGGRTLFDFTTRTTTNLGITGNSRNGRVLSGGTLRVINNLTDRYCDYSPTNVTWNSSCSCAVSGSWSASCSDSTTSTLTINSCGNATFTMDGTSTAVEFDRCSSL